MKYSVHIAGGVLVFETRLLKKAIEVCNEYDIPCKVCEEYLAPSVWDDRKIVRQARPIYHNLKQFDWT